MQAESREGTGRCADAQDAREGKVSEAGSAREPVTSIPELTECLAVDLTGEIITALAGDYNEGGKDHALAEFLFSVRELRTPYERWAASAALESLADRVEAGFGRYSNLRSTAYAMIEAGNISTPCATETVLRLLAAELSESAR